MDNGNMPAMPGLMKAGEVAKSEGGLTKREHFAGLAMQGLLSMGCECQGPPDVMAKHALACTDAIIAELERTS